MADQDESSVAPWRCPVSGDVMVPTSLVVEEHYRDVLFQTPPAWECVGEHCGYLLWPDEVPPIASASGDYAVRYRRDVFLASPSEVPPE